MNARTDLPGPLGVVYDMPAEEYHAVDALSATGMRLLARSPWHYRNRVPVVPTRPMLNGTLAHCAKLEPGALSARYIVVPDDAPKRPTKAQWGAKNPSPDSVQAMGWWKAFEKHCATRIIVPAEDYAITSEQLQALEANRELSDLFAKGHGEVSVFWIDQATGVYCKARPDWVRPTGPGRVKLVDLKTTADESPDAFARSTARMGYHRQRAHYWRGFEAASGLEVEDFIFATVTGARPVLAVPYRLVDEAVQQGEEERAELTQLYAECRHHDRWPAYTPEERMIDLPRWAKRDNAIEVEIVQ